jgi:hypothetical protein
MGMTWQQVPEDFEGAVPHEEVVGHSKDKRNERYVMSSQKPHFQLLSGHTPTLAAAPLAAAAASACLHYCTLLHGLHTGTVKHKEGFSYKTEMCCVCFPARGTPRVLTHTHTDELCTHVTTTAALEREQTSHKKQTEIEF